MVSSIVDEHGGDYYDHEMLSGFLQSQTVWTNGEQTDQTMNHIQQMKR